MAEAAERYDDMVRFMSHVAKNASDLSVDERNLLSVAYKNCVGPRRQAWRAVNMLESREGHKGPAIVRIIAKYRSKLESELRERCTDLIVILSGDLIPRASQP